MKTDPVWNDDFASAAAVVGVLSASPGALGGLRSQSNLVPLLLNLQFGGAEEFRDRTGADAFDRRATRGRRGEARRSRRDRPGVGRRGAWRRLDAIVLSKVTSSRA